MSPAEETVSIGCGSGFALDRLGPAVDLARSGAVTHLGFDSLAERTLAHAQTRKLADVSAGHDPRTARTVAGIGPFVAEGLTVVGSFGGANVGRALGDTVDGFRSLGLAGVTVAAIHGDDVLELMRELDPLIPELGQTVSALGDKVISANSYIGSEPIVGALEGGARWILGGRIADASLFAGPICHQMGWDLDDWDRVAHATLAGHILECSTQATGGYFADPPYREVPDLGNLGFPIAHVSESEIIVTKLPEAGGKVTEQTVALQVGYEVHNPAEYMTPDIKVDLTGVTCEQAGPDQVRVTGAVGAPRPDKAKVLVGVMTGHKAVAELSYAAAGCEGRARLAAEVVRETIDYLEPEIDEIRFDLVGVDALVGAGRSHPEPPEVRLRVAARCRSEEAAVSLTEEVERLYVHGPTGGGGATRSVVPAISVFPQYVDAAQVPTEVELVRT